MCGETMKILVIGGDERQIYLTENLKNKGYNAEHIFTAKNIKEKIQDSEYIILPLPSSKDGITVFNTLSTDKIFLSDLIEYTNNQEFFTCKLKLDSRKCFDYSELDSFAIKNAVPTAESAIAIAVFNSKKTIFGSKSLVIGYGRIGKILSKMLKDLGSDVTVSARKERDLSFIEAFNMNKVQTNNINPIADQFDFIFNTVDFPVIDTEFLKSMKNESLLIELASLPGGINADKTKTTGKIINAQGLPGKYSPFTAAEILASTIESIIYTKRGENL